MMNVYAVSNDYGLDKSVFEYLMSYTTEDKQKRIGNFNSLEYVQHILIADLLLCIVICSTLGLKNKDIIFVKNKYGEPFLKNDYGFCFNISHAGDWIVCATHSLPVGIAIEHI